MKRMTSLLALIAIGSALFLGACKKESPDPNGGSGGSGGTGGGGGQTVTRDIDFSYTETAAIPPTAATVFTLAQAGQYLEPYDGTFATNTDAELANEGFVRDDVMAIKGKSLISTIINTPGQNFDFLDTIKVFVAQKDGTGKVLFAYKYNYPLGKASLDLDMVDVDVKDIFKADSARIYFGGTKRAGNHPLQGNTQIDFNTTITATVRVD